MNWFEALILGIIQGLTEFLPVSSSGHLELGRFLLNHRGEQNLYFAVVVHGATVLSTIAVFYKDIADILRGMMRFQWNESTLYGLKIVASMIPVVLVGIFLSGEVEKFFAGRVVFVGSMLLITALLLTAGHFVPEKKKPVNFFHAMIIGTAQAFAVLPGISRSGATIATGLMLGNKRGEVARFSFLMVILPIIGANARDLISGSFMAGTEIKSGVLFTGFLAAFVSGFLACRWMVALVKRGKLIHFAIYCLIAGIAAIISGILIYD